MRFKILEVLKLLRTYYKDWLLISFSYGIGSTPKKAILRNGPTINVDSEKKNYFLIGLARLLRSGWRVQNVDDTQILLSDQNGVHFRCRTNRESDVGDLFTIFESKFYGEDFVNKTVLDVGMYNADSSIYFALKGAKLVIGLEPFSESYDLANQNIKINNLEEKIIPLQLGLSSTEGLADLDMRSNNPLGYSLQTPSSASKTEIETITIESLMKQFGLQRIDVLKMNCEGCEYDVIYHLSSETLSRIDNFLIQYHDGALGLLDYLSKSGFSVQDKNPNHQHGILFAHK